MGRYPPEGALTKRRQDGFKPANAWVANGIAWLDDIQSFYRERSAIEKEYSAKLNALAKKYFEKKTRKSASLSVGDTPTMTPGSLERYDFAERMWEAFYTGQRLTLHGQRIPHDMEHAPVDIGSASGRTRTLRQ